MTFFEKKIKNLILLYLRYRKKYIYNMIMNNAIKMLKDYVLKILPDLITFGIVFLKFYRVFYFTKVILDQIPMCNFYKWPFSILRIICKPYTKFWSRFLPKIKMGNTILDISYIVGIEVLARLSKLLLLLKIASINYAKN